MSQKNSITPAGVTSNGQKSPKIFFCIFGIRMTQFAKKKQKKFLTKNLVLECLECGPKRGQNDLWGRRVIHRLNCLAMSYLNMNFQPKALGRSRENAENLIFGHKRAPKKFWRFLTANPASSLFSLYNCLTFCKKAKKSLAPFSRKLVTN